LSIGPHSSFFRFVAVYRQVIGLCPVLYVVELCASRVLIHCWDDDVGIISILHRTFPGVAAVKSEASTTYDTGPVAEPCTMLAEIWQCKEVE